MSKTTLSLREYLEVDQLTEAWNTEFEDSQIEKAEYFNIKFNPVSQAYTLVLYDIQSEPLGAVEYKDIDVLMAFIEEYFDLGDEDSVPVEIEGDEENMMYIATSNYGMGQDLSDNSASALSAASSSNFGSLNNPLPGEPTLGSSDID